MRAVCLTDSVLYLVWGALAQLGERLVCNQEVAGSIPVRSIDLQIVGACLGTVCPRTKPLSAVPPVSLHATSPPTSSRHPAAGNNGVAFLRRSSRPQPPHRR